MVSNKKPDKLLADIYAKTLGFEQISIHVKKSGI
jgi:hypothetical protein